MTDLRGAEGTEPQEGGTGQDAAAGDPLSLMAEWSAVAFDLQPEATAPVLAVTHAISAFDAEGGNGSVSAGAASAEDDMIVLSARASDYFLAKQPDGTVTLLRFVPVSLDHPDGMEVLRGAAPDFIQFADRTIRVQDVPAAMTTGDALPEGDAGLWETEAGAATETAVGAGNVVSFGAAVAGLVRQGLAEGAAGGAGAEPHRLSVSVTALGDAPLLTGSGAPVTYVQSATSLLVAPNLTLGFSDGTTFAAARVDIAGARSGDRLVVANWRPNENGQTATIGNITLLYHNGALLLIGLASLAEYQGLLRMVGYANAAEQPDILPRSITISVNDGTKDVTVAQVDVVAAADGSGWTLAATAPVALPDVTDGAVADIPEQVAVDTAEAPSADPAVARTMIHVGDLAAGAGADVLLGSDGNDDLSTSGAEIVLGLGGDDRITLAADGAADVVIDGGDGHDTVILGDGVTEWSPATDDALRGVEQVTVAGTEGVALDLGAQTEDLVVDGGAGADTIAGGAGADSVSGGAGDDLFLAAEGDGSDVWMGDEGSDTISFDGVVAAVNIDLGAGVAEGSATGTDALVGIENATGGSGDDVIAGDAGDNRLDGGDGDDALCGGDGDDRLQGGKGDDILSGGEGNDIFSFCDPESGGTDIITDFRPGDRLEITASKFLMGLTNEQITSGSWFWRGVQAEDLDDRLIYDKDTGYLIYDSNGNRDGGDIVNIARFEKEPDFDNCDLSWMDFLVS